MLCYNWYQQTILKQTVIRECTFEIIETISELTCEIALFMKFVYF
jgi:hypothetical protein